LPLSFLELLQVKALFVCVVDRLRDQQRLRRMKTLRSYRRTNQETAFVDIQSSASTGFVFRFVCPFREVRKAKVVSTLCPTSNRQVQGIESSQGM
jgi:hypothetical protein